MDILGPKTPIDPIDTGSNLIRQSDFIHVGLLEVTRARDGNPDANVHVVLIYSKQTGNSVTINGQQFPVVEPMGARDVCNRPLSAIQADFAAAVQAGHLTANEVQEWGARAVAWDAEGQWIVDKLLSMQRQAGLLSKTLCPDALTETTPK
ncbi:MAG: hypothetical protein K1Y36_10385 [Blastocatellia bacterium]|nr:hypothetical protein [Blastocatellia bacterium]